MLANYQNINNSLSEDVLEDAKLAYESHLINHHNSKEFSTLAQMLYELKIEIPESMLLEINRSMKFFPPPRFNFKAFTHFVARATLEEQLEDEIRNLFYLIDKNKTGCIDAQDVMELLKELQHGQRMSQQQINEMVKEMDHLNVGYLNYEDFVYLLLPK